MCVYVCVYLCKWIYLYKLQCSYGYMSLGKKAWKTLKNTVNKGYAGLRVGRLDLGWRGLKEEKAIEISKTSMMILNVYICIYNYMH